MYIFFHSASIHTKALIEFSVYGVIENACYCASYKEEERFMLGLIFKLH